MGRSAWLGGLSTDEDRPANVPPVLEIGAQMACRYGLFVAHWLLMELMPLATNFHTYI